MGRSQAEKAASRERILTRAAEQIRESGFDSVSVGKLMRSADLTHGGFYNHFASRSDLLAQALERALDEGFASARAQSDTGERLDLATIVRTYLSPLHRDSPKTGCAIAALAAEAAHADDRIRAVMDTYVGRFIENIENAMASGDEARAMLVASAMVGGLLLSRAMVDEQRSSALLAAVCDQLIVAEEPPPPNGP